MTKREYKPLTIPRLKWVTETLDSRNGELIAQPLEPGSGITLGNALRRVLLASVEGSAVTSVVIKGVNNEFAYIPGVIEDVMQIILNIKGIVIKNNEGRAGTMHAHKKGPGELRVADIVPDAHLELVNKDHVIAHLAADGELDIQFFVESGRGYQEAQWPAGKALQEDNRIYIDAMFSPVKRIAFDVEKTRVGGDIDYDKLTLHLQTNGAESPADVLHYGVSVLRTQLEHFLKSAEIQFNEIAIGPEDRAAQAEADAQLLKIKGVPVDLLMKPIEELELSVRAHNCLVNAGIKRVYDLVNLSKDEVLKIKNLGRKSLSELEESMKTFGLTFGMDVKEADIKKLFKHKNSVNE